MFPENPSLSRLCCRRFENQPSVFCLDKQLQQKWEIAFMRWRLIHTGFEEQSGRSKILEFMVVLSKSSLTIHPFILFAFFQITQLGGLVKAGLDVAQIWLDGNETLLNTIDQDGNILGINMVDGHAITPDPLVAFAKYVPPALHDIHQVGTAEALNSPKESLMKDNSSASSLEADSLMHHGGRA